MATASHVYAQPGSYTATLTVTDAAGNSATTTFTVTVRPNGLLGLVQILAAIVAILAIAVGFLMWTAFGRRKRDRAPPNTAASPPQTPLPSREVDPLDMRFPPAPPPKGP